MQTLRPVDEAWLRGAWTSLLLPNASFLAACHYPLASSPHRQLERAQADDSAHLFGVEVGGERGLAVLKLVYRTAAVGQAIVTLPESTSSAEWAIVLKELLSLAFDLGYQKCELLLPRNWQAAAAHAVGAVAEVEYDQAYWARGGFVDLVLYGMLRAEQRG